MTYTNVLNSFDISALKNYSLSGSPSFNGNEASLFASSDPYSMAMAMDTYASALPSIMTNMNTMGAQGGFSGFQGFSGMTQNGNNGAVQIDGAGLMQLWNASVSMMKTKMQSLTPYLNFNTNLNFNTTPTQKLKDINYDASSAKSIASNALSSAGSSSKKRCAEYVSNAIAKTGLSIQRGDAYQMENNLRQSKKFKEITVSKSELASLPAGCMLVYPKGVAGYSSQYGHIEVTLGDGRAASDFVNKNPKYDPQMKVFVPVAA